MIIFHFRIMMLKTPILKVDLNILLKVHLLAQNVWSYKMGCKWMTYWLFKIFKLMKTEKYLCIVKLCML